MTVYRACKSWGQDWKFVWNQAVPDNSIRLYEVFWKNCRVQGGGLCSENRKRIDKKNRQAWGLMMSLEAYKVKKRRQKGLHSLKKLCKTKQKSCRRNALRVRLVSSIDCGTVPDMENKETVDSGDTVKIKLYKGFFGVSWFKTVNAKWTNYKSFRTVLTIIYS